MTDRPILFSAPMIRSLLNGRKTQTRRVLKPQPPANVTSAGVFSSSRDGMTDKWSWLSGDPRDCDTWGFEGDFSTRFTCGYRLWVKETHAIVPATAYRASDGVQQTAKPGDDHDAAIYRAGWDRSLSQCWKSGRFMPRWASRLTLLVTDVRVERLQDISEADALAEGIVQHEATMTDPAEFTIGPDGNLYFSAREAYAALWNSINGPNAWEADPWVVAVSFIVECRNIDA